MEWERECNTDNALLHFQASMTVNCSSIIVGAIALCLMSVDVTRPIYPGFFPVRSKICQIERTTLCEKWLKHLCLTASGAGALLAGIHDLPLGRPLPLFLQRKTQKVTLMAPTDLYTWEGVGGRGGVGWGVCGAFGAFLFYIRWNSEPRALWSSSTVESRPCGKDMSAFLVWH